MPFRWHQAALDLSANRPEAYALVQEASSDAIQLSGQLSQPTFKASWVYALVAPFPTYTDVVSGTDLRSAWSGVPAGPFLEHPLIASPESLAVGETLLAAPA